MGGEGWADILIPTFIALVLPQTAGVPHQQWGRRAVWVFRFRRFVPARDGSSFEGRGRDADLSRRVQESFALMSETYETVTEYCLNLFVIIPGAMS